MHAHQELPRCKPTSPGHDVSAGGCAACRGWRQGRQRQLSFCQKQLTDDADIASHAEGPLRAAEEELYMISCSLLQELRGLRLAVQDMRDVLKQLCLLPRYPDDDDEIPQLLRNMPSAFSIAGARHECLHVCCAEDTKWRAVAVGGGGGTSAWCVTSNDSPLTIEL